MATPIRIDLSFQDAFRETDLVSSYANVAANSWSALDARVISGEPRIGRLEDQSFRGVFDQGDSYAGPREVAGTIVASARPQNVGLMLTAMFATATTSASGAFFDHGWAPATVPDVTTHCAHQPFTLRRTLPNGTIDLYGDCVLSRLTFEVRRGELARLTAAFIGGQVQAWSGTATAVDTTIPWDWSNATVYVGSAQTDQVQALTWEFSDNVRGWHGLSDSTHAKRIEKTGRFQVRIRGDIMFEDRNRYDKFVIAAKEDIQLRLDSDLSSQTLILSTPVAKWTQYKPRANRVGAIMVPFEARGELTADDGTQYASSGTIPAQIVGSPVADFGGSTPISPPSPPLVFDEPTSFGNPFSSVGRSILWNAYDASEGLWVLSASGGLPAYYATSTDRQEWTILERSQLNPGFLLSVNGVWIGGSSGNSISRSTDKGASWSSVATGLPSSSIDFMFLNGTFIVMVTTNYTAWSDDDGLTWTLGTGYTNWTAGLRTWARSPEGRYLMVRPVSSSITWLLSSNDGKAWDVSTLSNFNIVEMTYGDGKFVAWVDVFNQAMRRYYSTDGGSSWIGPQSLPISPAIKGLDTLVNQLEFGSASRFMGTLYNPNSPEPVAILTSSDGITWDSTSNWGFGVSTRLQNIISNGDVLLTWTASGGVVLF